jgi:hypothetical protein
VPGALLLTLVLGATSEVWTATQGPAQDGACNADAFAAAVRAQRPSLVVRAWHVPETERPPAGAMRAQLTWRGTSALLQLVSSGGASVVRELPADDCTRLLETAALIVDGMLETIPSGPAPEIGLLAPPVPWVKQLRVSALAGAGTAQGTFGFVPVVDIEGQARVRFWELTLGADLELPSTAGFSVTPPEAGSGTVSVSAAAATMGIGFAPRVGPGRLSADAVLGLALRFASVESPAVFQTHQATSETPFGGARLGYAIDLPWRLLLALRAEERAGPSTNFEVVGGSFQGSWQPGLVTTPVWSFRALAFLGFNFF